jgi:ribosome-binding ATPase YchF (GTP1/OBG family)
MGGAAMIIEKLIGQILDAERRAQGMALDAVQQQQGLEDELAAAIAEMQGNYAQQTEKRLDRIRKDNEAKTQQTLKSLTDQYEEKLRQMDAIYAAEKDNWAEMLFSRIIAV